MKVETLVVTTKQLNYELLERMNIQTAVIVGNQCEKNEISEFEYRGRPVKWYSFRESGVGLNRNNILMRSTADVCVFADDDMVFKDGYEEIVSELFKKYPKADVMLFNLDEENPTQYKNNKVRKINQSNYGTYGAARMAVRRESIFLNNIFFSLIFGGGTKYSSGEDSIFLYECIKKKLNVLAVPVSIAELTSSRRSTWFEGYNDKFFFDKGVLYSLLYGKVSRGIAFYNCFKHRNKEYKGYGWKNSYRQMCCGIQSMSRR